MKDQLMAFWKDEEGATAIEYALIAGLIAVAIIGALTALGGNISTLFGKISNELNSVEVNGGS
ncbi:Flp family type IVb pilin [Advenella sp. RU8]|uniref:Flp family type IVb pilin n=1 Tax=Advenella sp. RU8 TaxID=3399575 RepID=UPI003AB0BEE2